MEPSVAKKVKIKGSGASFFEENHRDSNFEQGNINYTFFFVVFFIRIDIFTAQPQSDS